MAFLMVIVLYLLFTGLGKRRTVDRIQCANRLRALAVLAYRYASTHGGKLPFEEANPPRAFSSLQRIVDSQARPPARDPNVYVCPNSSEEAASPDATGYFELTERNVSYAWIAAPVSTEASSPERRMIACCNSLNHHKDGILILYLDSSIGWVSRREIEENYGGFDAFLHMNHLTR
jgi:hypothetical protein